MAELAGRARFVEENYGDSELATRFGVTRYPAIFVGDVLVATPNDFGFYGRGEAETGGRYAPLKSVEAHERFQADLRRMLALLLFDREGRLAASFFGAPPGQHEAVEERIEALLRSSGGRPPDR